MINTTAKERTIPSLKKLAAETIKRTNPHLFFRFYQQPLSPEIQAEYVDPFVTEFMKCHQDNYLRAVAKRKKEVRKKSGKLSQDRCFSHVCICLNGVCASGLYLGIGYPLLQFTHAPLQTVATFYALVPLLLAVGSCSSICLIPLIVHAIAECTTASVGRGDVVIDLEAQIEKKPKHRFCALM